MKAQIKREFTFILIGSLLIGIFFRVGWFFPVRLMIMSTLLINFGLAVCMWYSEGIKRPLLYQVMIIFYLGITAYCYASINETELWGVSYDGKLVAKVSLLFIMGATLVSLISYKPLCAAIKSRVDLWCPPIWPLVIAGVITYISGKTFENSTIRLSVLIGMGGLILGTAYKNNRTQNRTVAYQITTRHYLTYLCIFSILAFSINSLIPKVEELPGTKLMRQLTNNWGKGYGKEMQSTSKLSRNPTQSEEIVLEIKSERPIYLREMAYSTYGSSKWSVEDEVKEIQPIGKQVFYSEKKLFNLVLDKMLEGKMSDEALMKKYEKALRYASDRQEEMSVYIEEVMPVEHYFTCNDMHALKVLEEDKIGYYNDMDNLFFVSMAEGDDVAYTIDYTYYPIHPNTRETEVLGKLSQKEFLRILDATSFSKQELTDEIKALIRTNKDYKPLYEKYCQLPEDIKDQIISLADQLTKEKEGDLSKANAICDYLKRSGEYTYELGAPYVDKERDALIDFLFYGKAGICQDFASSMTLLCRGIGLPARYVVGYYSSERDWEKEQTYIVREKDAHAFVEVYIGGYGWMTFDPTPAMMKADELIGGDITKTAANNNIGNGLGEFKILFIVLGIFLCIFIWLYPIAWLKQIIWKWYLLRLPPKKSIGLLMEQTLKLLENKSIFLEERETVSKLAKRLSDQYLIDITPITKPFERFYYGGKEPLENEMLSAILCYNKLKKSH